MLPHSVGGNNVDLWNKWIFLFLYSAILPENSTALYSFKNTGRDANLHSIMLPV